MNSVNYVLKNIFSCLKLPFEIWLNMVKEEGVKK